MTDKLTEYKRPPILSQQAQSFVDMYNGNVPIPDNIRSELEQYVKDNEPFVQQAHQRLANQFAKIFNK
jgi:hypothetical protein